MQEERQFCLRVWKVKNYGDNKVEVAFDVDSPSAGGYRWDFTVHTWRYEGEVKVIECRRPVIDPMGDLCLERAESIAKEMRRFDKFCSRLPVPPKNPSDFVRCLMRFYKLDYVKSVQDGGTATPEEHLGADPDFAAYIIDAAIETHINQYVREQNAPAGAEVN